MQLQQEQKTIQLNTEKYSVNYDRDKPFYISVLFKNGLGGSLFIPSGCDRDEIIDEIVSLEQPKLEEHDDRTIISFSGITTLWKKAIYTFECLEDRILYSYKVYGKGKLDNARFFEGFLDDDPRMEKAFYPYFQGAHRSMVYKRPWKYFAKSSVPTFEKLYSFSINSSDTREFMYYENTTLRVNGDRANLGVCMTVLSSIQSLN